MRPGIDGVLVGVVIGDGTLGVPVDVALRRPDPQGPGAPCRDQLRWVQGRRDERLAALGRRGLHLPAPVVVADRWVGDSTLRRQVGAPHQGTCLVEGKHSSVLTVPDGRQVKGRTLVTRVDWPWRDSPWAPRVRYARLQATSPTYGPVTLVMLDDPGQERLYLMCLETSLSAPQLLRRWRRRRWSE